MNFKKLKVAYTNDYGLVTHQGGEYVIVFDAVSKKRILMRGTHRFGNTTIRNAPTLVERIETIEEAIQRHGGVLSKLAYKRQWTLETRGGPLEITIYETWVAMCFVYPEKAATLGIQHLNGYSGKWNYHMSSGIIDADAYLKHLEKVL